MTLCAPWATTADLCEPCDDYIVSDSIDTYLEMASELLYKATAQQYPGECDVIVHPCACSWFSDRDLTVNNGILTLATYTHFQACGCSTGSSCSCRFRSSIELPYGPVAEITSVTTTDDGELPLGSYDFRGNELVRLDGNRWPLCDDDFLVSYVYGVAPPRHLRHAAAILACELYMGCNPDAFDDAPCKLPRNIVSVVRQGTSIALQSAFFTPLPGRPVQFGIPEIDMAIALENPYGLTAPMVVLDPDEPDLGYVVT